MCSTFPPAAALLGLLSKASAEKGEGLTGGGARVTERSTLTSALVLERLRTLLLPLLVPSPLGFLTLTERPLGRLGTAGGAGGGGVGREGGAAAGAGGGAWYSTREEELRSRMAAWSNLELVSAVELLPDLAAESFAFCSSDFGLP